MFVGEAPGADEDVQGEPFVGRAGQLLTKIIEAIGLQRSDVYIANVIKCRPPGNRNPEPDEVATCEPFLIQQIDSSGRASSSRSARSRRTRCSKTDAPISRLRGRVHDFRGGAKLIPTFHPAFLLRSPERKRDVWEDMKKVRDLLAEGRLIALVAVAVPVPGLGLLSYRVPGRRDRHKGARVRVPLGARARHRRRGRRRRRRRPRRAMLRDVHEVIDAEPFLPPTVVDLALWVGEYYASGPGDALALAMPPSRAAAASATSFRTVRVVELAGGRRATPSTLEGAKQRAAIDAPARDARRRDAAGAAAARRQRRDTVRSLARVGLVRLRDAGSRMRDPFGGDAAADGGHWSMARAGRPRPRADARAGRRVPPRSKTAAAAQTFRTVLLHGVTGSGKTELYLRLAGT